MNNRHFIRKIEGESTQSSQLLLYLRMERMKINPLLRYCSLTIFVSYIITIISSFNLCNQIGTKWVTACFLLFFILLFVSWLWVQDHYSEKRAERKNIIYKKLRYVELSGGNYSKTYRRYFNILSGLAVTCLLLLIWDLAFNHTPVMIFLAIAGTSLYILTLFMIRKLLIEKLVLKQTISSMHQRLLIADNNRSNFMAVAADQIIETQNNRILS
jgi:drug/metabolite transporter (DMT)-like permease